MALLKPKGIPLTPAEHRLLMRAAAIIAMPLALITLLAVVAGFLVYRSESNARFARNREAIAANVANGQALSKFVYKQCLDNEVRDSTFVLQAKAILLVVEKLPTTLERENLIQVLLSGIVVREPPDEPQCIPPKEGNP